jgi:hypothetical protein
MEVQVHALLTSVLFGNHIPKLHNGARKKAEVPSAYHKAVKWKRSSTQLRDKETHVSIWEENERVLESFWRWWSKKYPVPKHNVRNMWYRAVTDEKCIQDFDREVWREETVRKTCA